MRKAATSVLPLLVATACVAAGCARAPARDDRQAAASTAAAPTSASALAARLTAFAHDSTLGRLAGTAAHDKATDWIAATLRRAGLQPAGDGGTYFQAVTFTRRALPRDARLAIGPATLMPWRDFVVYPYLRGDRPIEGVELVYGGNVGDSLLDPDVVGRRAVAVRSTSSAGRTSVMAALANRYPLATAILVLGGLDAGLTTADIHRLALGVTAYGTGDPAETMLPGPAFVLLRGHWTERLLAGGSQIPGRSLGTLHGDVRLRSEQVTSRNVVAVLPGRDPGLRGQYVALGAHSDHVGVAPVALDHDSLRTVLTIARPTGADSPEIPLTDAQQARVRIAIDSIRRLRRPRPDSVYNGADDDGSGTVALLGVAEALARGPRPRRSVLFVFHTAEELGLYGSRRFTEFPTVARDSIVAQLNVDQIGRGGEGDGLGRGPAYLGVVGSRRLSTELGDLIERVNEDEGLGFALDYTFDAAGDPRQFYCRSDHANYARYGIPVAFLFTGTHADYHQVTDEVAYVDMAKLSRATRLLVALAARIADMEHRIAVDKPVSGPAQRCQQ